MIYLKTYYNIIVFIYFFIKMRFAIISDIHIGPEWYYNWVLRKINSNVKVFLNNFIDDMNNNERPEFVVVLWDTIEDDTIEKDTENLRYVVDLFESLKCPVYYVAGNHDLKTLSEQKLADIFYLKKLYYSFEKGDYKFIVLCSLADGKWTILISEEQKIWLKKELEKSDKDCVVFVHHWLSDQDLTGNPRFEWRPQHCLITNRK